MTTPRPPAERASHLHGAGMPLEPGRGVDHVRSTLTHWGLDGGLPGTDALVVAGELLANAHQHAGGATALRLTWSGTRLRIEVSDNSSEPPGLITPHESTRLFGHGLYLVERLSTRWGSRCRSEGKTVWADLRLPHAP
ncbi:ATP-binding protein [Streptacidiphilus rugosus]|uniref:ATP-binding protein n=1 Tax=Streptacidiphilus rugosus TaxID=405783 RepID=UPI00068E0451|nr:ATP-binding protein [Streptacidiphilus rugosus]